MARIPSKQTRRVTTCSGRYFRSDPAPARPSVPNPYPIPGAYLKRIRLHVAEFTPAANQDGGIVYDKTQAAMDCCGAPGMSPRFQRDSPKAEACEKLRGFLSSDVRKNSNRGEAIGSSVGEAEKFCISSLCELPLPCVTLRRWESCGEFRVYPERCLRGTGWGQRNQ